MKELLVTALFLAHSLAFAADPQAPTANPMQQEMMKKFMEFSTPSEGHKQLQPIEGTWNYTSTMWESQKGKPAKSNGQSVFKMILGGRYLQQDFKGMAMGQPFEGLGFIGYNNVEKRYETFWLDTMGTGVTHGHGAYNAKSKTISEKGEFTCPLTENKKRDYRSEWIFIDNNNMTFQMYAPDLESGKEFKNLEIVYKRAL